MAKLKKIVLSDEVAAKYEVANKPVSNRFIDTDHGLIDFRAMTVKRADYLVARNFHYLKAKKVTKDTSKRGSE